ncbi:mannonate dehydratase [Brachyspira hyodysenteriae]|uniref:Mannonate dehydratase n=1 Tax=Brachyspira hyodysenteriae ATCC 27164 TaxID=1266923 RepID=A0A3B6VRB5_BRAHO|nr:mannonate dehydratase [Brachyspira hyodysenteriae]ANN63234.1 mannonate dehydratase [Brachyspira hyodysenteriae ATCC 27164]KLI24684.1 mannonate dehydratase [Brachyspira hyodysenteriae]KLI39844.1 mannonate dehydratase [Brachyspira hyodysenteriae]KLI61054.1 mannonate dehydratase [Brachyspira hyodysenteriae]MCZ9892783.1 mannonate dehydratase [Brachyspira hyodysenteriae]
MIMTLRWFGKNFDSVTLKQIRQIPGVKGVITTLYDSKVGDAWKEEDVKAIKKEVEDAGLKIYGIESVNIHDDIKIGLPSRDKYIENYIKTLEVLGKEGINLVCYNFMPVFDWTRSDLAKVRPDGSTVLSYDQDIIDKIDPQKMFEQIDSNSNGFVLPGWEPERLSRLKELFEMYKGIDDEKLFENLKYFLTAIMPTCEKYNIKMAIHPDDPAWPVFGLPRIIVNKENILRMVNSVNSPCNGITLCAGSLGSNPKNDIPDIIRSLKGKIFFAHVRNLEHTAPGKFQEAAHLSSDGSMDMFAIMKAFYDIGFEGPFRPDHGRAIWDEVSMPGYGLYDRALGAVYLQGLWEAIEKMGK